MVDPAARRPKLLVLTSTLPRWAGDAEPRFVLDLARALQPRFDPTVLAPMAPGAKAEDLIEGVAIRRYRYAPVSRWETLASPGAIMPNLRARPWLMALVPFFILAQFTAVVGLLRRERFDAVHCHWIVPQGLVLALAGLFVRVPPTLTTCHGADAFTLDGPVMRWVKRLILRRSAALTAVSREIASHLSDRIAAGPTPQHIPMGVDAHGFARASSAERAPEPTILFAGRLAAKKGVAVLLRALADERLARLGVRLRLVGNGPLEGELRRLATDLGIEHRVDFVSAVAHHELVEEMGRAHLFCAPFVVSPDGDREGTPTVVIEAAAAGCPIVTSDIGGCSDIVRDGVSGWLLPPGDVERLTAALVEALTQPALAAARAQEAQRIAGQFDWPRIATRYGDLIGCITSEERTMAVTLDPMFGALAGDDWFPSPAHVMRRAAVLDAVRDLPPGRLLEMGCGAGRFLADWHAMGHSGHAADLDRTARALAARCASAFGADFAIVDAPPADLEGGFDYLVSTEVLEHIDDPAAALADWSRFLKDDGTLVLTVPAFAHLWGKSDEWAGHVQRFEPEALRAMVEAAGFEVRSLVLYGYPVGNLIRLAGNAASALKMRRREAVLDRHAATLSSGRDRSIEAKLRWLFRSMAGRAVLRLGIVLQRHLGCRGKGHGIVLVARKRRAARTVPERLCAAA